MAEEKSQPSNISNIMDTAITGTIISSFINSSNTITKQLGTVIIMSSIDEVKKSISDIFTYIRQHFPTILQYINPKVLWSIIIDRILSYLRKIKSLFSRRTAVAREDTYIVKDDTFKITLDVNINFITNILEYIQLNNDSCVAEIQPITSTVINGRTDIKYYKTFSKFEINYEGMKISASPNLNICYDGDGNSMSYCKTQDLNVYRDIRNLFFNIREALNTYKCIPFTTLFNNHSQIYKFLFAYTKYYKTYGNISRPDTLIGFDHKNAKPIIEKVDPQVDYTPFYINEILQKLFTTRYSNNVYLIELFYRYCYINNIKGVDNMVTTNCITVGGVVIRSENINRSTVLKVPYKIEDNRDMFANIREVVGNNLNIERLNQECEYILSTLFVNPYENDQESDKLILKIKNYDEKKYLQFIKNISSISYKKNNEIKIHDVKMIEDIKIIENPNPEYTKLSEQLAIFEEAKSDKAIDIKSKLVQIEPTLKTKDISYNIECKFITKKYKTFSTLYLKKDDKEQLTNLIDTYSKKKALIRSLGIPDKLGILLAGLAGTGKTSTIWTIATELQKDIFYVHLNTVKTDSQLTQIFEYVNNQASGGIIVFEDIDAMTNIVLARTLSSENSDLTLGHFLNLLQGTLTHDDTTFIITTNHLEKLDPALYRAGRFDIVINFTYANRYQCNQIYHNFMNRHLPDNILNTIPEDKFIPASFIFYLYKYIWKQDCSDEEIISGFLSTLN